MAENVPYSRTNFTVLGARNFAVTEREQHDYYATDPKALELLLELENFAPRVWECACGEGHLSKVLEAHGHEVFSTDLIDRGYGTGNVNFLASDCIFDGDIITNPPYKYAEAFIRKALEIVTEGHKVAMFLKVQFLEGKARKKLFEQYPPRTVYVSSSRLSCALNGEFGRYENKTAIAHAWFVWEKGYHGDTVIKWFN